MKGASEELKIIPFMSFLSLNIVRHYDGCNTTHHRRKPSKIVLGRKTVKALEQPVHKTICDPSQSLGGNLTKTPGCWGRADFCADQRAAEGAHLRRGRQQGCHLYKGMDHPQNPCAVEPGTCPGPGLWIALWDEPPLEGMPQTFCLPSIVAIALEVLHRSAQSLRLLPHLCRCKARSDVFSSQILNLYVKNLRTKVTLLFQNVILCLINNN